jgi:hypothetical protein
MPADGLRPETGANEVTLLHDPQLGGVFTDRDDAEAAVADLRALGLADEHLGVAVHEGRLRAFEQEAGTAVAAGIGRGVALGAPIGAIAGMTVLALAVPGVGAIAVGGILAAGGVTGALAGGFWGAYLGLTSAEHALDDEWDWEKVPLEPGQVLVVVDQHGRPEDVREVLLRHGGRVVAKPSHIA